MLLVPVPLRKELKHPFLLTVYVVCLEKAEEDLSPDTLCMMCFRVAGLLSDLSSVIPEVLHRVLICWSGQRAFSSLSSISLQLEEVPDNSSSQILKKEGKKEREADLCLCNFDPSFLI